MVKQNTTPTGSRRHEGAARRPHARKLEPTSTSCEVSALCYARTFGARSMPEQYNLREVVQKLTQAFPAIESLHLFGSRRYRTGSPRSDIDILVSVNRYIRPTELRQFSQAHGPALDLFLVDGGKAVSCANESRVEAASFNELTDKLDAIHFWD